MLTCPSSFRLSIEFMHYLLQEHEVAGNNIIAQFVGALLTPMAAGASRNSRHGQRFAIEKQAKSSPLMVEVVLVALLAAIRANRCSIRSRNKG